jgi:hypothetical protein
LLGGFAGTIASNLLKVMEIDYVRVFQNTTVDTQAPIDWQKSGTVTSSSVELLMNATDNSL